jgi:DNA-binding NtrC family response regulator
LEAEGGPPVRLSPPLQHHPPWPGNVRDLQNRVRRAAILAEGKRVTARDLELTDALSAAPAQTLKEAREGVEREMVQDTCGGTRENYGGRFGAWR